MSLMWTGWVNVQISKLVNIPFIAMVEMLWLKKHYTVPVLGSMLLVVTGVGIVTVSDLGGALSVVGICVACASVVSSSFQQILCGVLQNKYQLTSRSFLLSTAPYQV